MRARLAQKERHDASPACPDPCPELCPAATAVTDAATAILQILRRSRKSQWGFDSVAQDGSIRSIAALIGAVFAFALSPTQALAAEADPTAAHEAIDDAETVDPEAAAELTLPGGQRWVPLEEVDEEVGPQQSSEVGTQRKFDRRERKGIYTATYSVKANESLRSIAYRYCTSPSLLAVANGLPFDATRDAPLKQGTKLQVPVQFRAPSGFREGEQLLSGPGVESERHDSNWGRPHVVQLLRQVFRDMNKRWPMRHPALLGSLSRPGGGKLGRHKSHRSGHDVDVGYLTYEANRKGWGAPPLDQIDYQRMWFLVDALDKTGRAAAIYMSPGIQKRLHAYAAGHGEKPERLQMLFQAGPKGGRGDTLIRFQPGHRDHFHVRFLGPEDWMAGRDS